MEKMILSSAWVNYSWFHSKAESALNPEFTPESPSTTIGGVILRADNDNFTGPNDTIPSASTLVSGLQNIGWNLSQGETTNIETGQVEHKDYIPLFVGISQEGDSYPTDQILNGLTSIPSPMSIGATWDPQLAQSAGLVMGKELRAIGFNFYLGPSLDVLETTTAAKGDDLGVRTFGGDPFWVGDMGKAYIRGLHLGSREEMAVIAKHFPGRGSSDRLPEEEVATVRKPLEQLKQVDLAPFFAVTSLKPIPFPPPTGCLCRTSATRGFATISAM